MHRIYCAAAGAHRHKRALPQGIAAATSRGRFVSGAPAPQQLMENAFSWLTTC